LAEGAWGNGVGLRLGSTAARTGVTPACNLWFYIGRACKGTKRSRDAWGSEGERCSVTPEFKPGARARLCRDPESPCRLQEGVALCDRATFDVATRWIAIAGTAGPEERRAFDAWLAESNCHHCVWARVQYLWELLGDAL
jgi:hypothetical protein